ncbi:MAG TPA: hypothetical protein VIG80_04950, partial [Bacillaceae bacterium]
DLQQQMEEMKRQQEAAVMKTSAIRELAPAESLSDNKKQDRLPFERQDDIIKGIIMSEVLGPPRAKRPYRRTGRV